MTVTSRESVAAVLGLLLAVASATKSPPKLASFITYGNDEEVAKCADVLSYLCGETKEDRCVSPKDFCDGVNSCSSSWDEQACDKALPGYSKTEEKLRSTRLYWISMTLPGCAKLCDNTPECQGFSYHASYKRCQIHTRQGDISDLSDKWTTYERAATAEKSSTRGARYLFDIPSAPSQHQNRRRRQAGGQHRSPPIRDDVAETRFRRGCGAQPVFYMPPRKQVATTRIVGGSKVPYGAFPWQAEIKVKRNNYETHHCGGAVISPRHVLTAAHCVISHQMSDYVVILGDHELDRKDPQENRFSVKKITPHPKYNRETKKHDIAILELKEPEEAANLRKQSTYNEKTRPVCLPAAMPRPGTECVVTGWGLMNPNDDASLSTSLRAAMVSIIAEKDCSSAAVYGHKKHYYSEGMMCAGYLRGGVDACKGDSGGPLACRINGRFQLVGVVSWGDSCAEPNKPGVYTRVSQYIDWINEKMR